MVECMKWFKRHSVSVVIGFCSIALVILRAMKVTDWDWIAISIVFIGSIGVILSLSSSVKSMNRVVHLSDKVDSFGMEVIDNPEWIYLILDAEEKKLFGIRKNGSIEWGAGIPTPIREKLDELQKRINILEIEK